MFSSGLRLSYLTRYPFYLKVLESTSKLQALCEAAPTSDARPDGDVHAALLAEWHEMTGFDVTPRG